MDLTKSLGGIGLALRERIELLLLKGPGLPRLARPWARPNAGHAGAPRAGDWGSAVKKMDQRRPVRLSNAGNAAMDRDELIPTRQSLLSRLKDWEDGASWKDFFDTYWKLIYGTARRAGLQPSDAEEVVQETLITVSKSIRNFQYDPQQGSFKSWLRTTTLWRIQDRLRMAQRRRTLDALQQQAEPLIAQPEDALVQNWDSEWDKALADAAMERVKRKVAPRHFQIFDLAMVKQWPAAKVAETLHVRAGYVYLVKHRVAAQIRAELKKLQREPYGAPDRPSPS